MRHHARDCQDVATAGKYKALLKQYFTWGHEINVSVFLFVITRLPLQGEELCELISNTFRQPKVNI